MTRRRIACSFPVLDTWGNSRSLAAHYPSRLGQVRKSWRSPPVDGLNQPVSTANKARCRTAAGFAHISPKQRPLRVCPLRPTPPNHVTGSARERPRIGRDRLKVSESRDGVAPRHVRDKLIFYRPLRRHGVGASCTRLCPMQPHRNPVTAWHAVALAKAGDVCSARKPSCERDVSASWHRNGTAWHCFGGVSADGPGERRGACHR